MPNAAAAARPARSPACGGLVVHPQNTFSIVTKRAPRTYCARFARAQCRRRAAAKQNNENSGRGNGNNAAPPNRKANGNPNDDDDDGLASGEIGGRAELGPIEAKAEVGAGLGTRTSSSQGKSTRRKWI